MSDFADGVLRELGLPRTAAARLVGAEPPLPARLPVGGLARAAVGAFALAAETARDAVRGTARHPDDAPDPIPLDPVRIAASFRSERLGRLDGRAPAAWDPLSGFFRSADGWVRTHANYPWHAAALRSALGCGSEADREAVAAAIAERPAQAVESAVYAAGGLAVAVRDPAAWARLRGPADAPLRLARSGARRSLPSADPMLPLAGVRILDLTRVIAGPVATRALAGLGADVLRVDAPARPEPLWQWLDTGRGKRSTLLDLGDRGDRERFVELLARADVVITGARPGALARFGLESEQLADSHPSIVTARVRAWAPCGDWGDRRGFDSLVQAASGIAAIEGETNGDGAPGRLPAQALDHSAGALLAAGVASLLAEARAGHVAVALEDIARALIGARACADGAGAGAGACGLDAAETDPELLRAVDGFEPVAAPSRWGRLGIVGEAYLPRWQPDPGPWEGRPFGSDAPAWR